jgi:hypothetical protein
MFPVDQASAPILKATVPSAFVNVVQIDFKNLDKALKFYEADGHNFLEQVPVLK